MILLLIIVALVGLRSSLQGAETDSMAPVASSSLVFAEQGGLVAVEAEHFLQQEFTTVRAWHRFTPVQRPRLTPDTDGTHVKDASGGGYIELLPDSRWTHDEKLVPGENFMNEPGKMAVLSYKVHFSTPGRYHFWARVFSTGTEDNGFHVGLDGAWPESGLRWQTTRKNAWSWDSRQRTAAVHGGVLGQLYLDVTTASEHTIQISMREDGIEIDKWLMTTDPNYTPQGTGPAARIHAGRAPAAFDLPADYREYAAPTPLSRNAKSAPEERRPRVAK